VTLTSCGSEYLAAQRTTARKIEAELVAELGETAFTALHELLDALGHGEETRMRTYMQRSSADVSSTDRDIEPTDHDHQ
jgi:hypothetical protein